jgi:hypothetical protein
MTIPSEEAGTPPGARPGRRLDAAIGLLDRQLVDRDGRLVGKVDDVELARRDDGRLVVTALLTGPGALGERLPGVLGRATLAVWRRLHPDADPVPARIEISAVREIGSVVQLGRSSSDVPNQRLEAWARRQIVAKLPGSDHDSDGEADLGSEAHHASE